jgi:hypothetical protein
MPASIRLTWIGLTLKTALVAIVLVLSAHARVGGEGVIALLALLAIINVVFALPGTMAVRMVTTAVAVAGIAVPAMTGPAALILWLVWPPALIIAWLIARDGRDELRADVRANPATRARIIVAIVIAAVAIASLMYRALVAHHLQQTAALFIGIPSVLAIIVTVGVSPRSATGVICKAVTIGLLVSLLFLGEGAVCVLMSAPLFYTVAVLIGVSADLMRRRSREPAGTSLRSVVLLAVLPFAMEGVVPATSLNRDELVTATAIVPAPAADVARAIYEPPRFERPLPGYLRIGFPRPSITRIARTDHGARWEIEVRGGEMRIDGIEPRTGTLVLDVIEARPQSVRWRATSDDSHMTHYLTWQESSVAWKAVGPRSTEVTWTLRYRRGLDPAWYFGPWERYAARLAARYLIGAVATP